MNKATKSTPRDLSFYTHPTLIPHPLLSLLPVHTTKLAQTTIVPRKRKAAVLILLERNVTIFI